MRWTDIGFLAAYCASNLVKSSKCFTGSDPDCVVNDQSQRLRTKNGVHLRQSFRSPRCLLLPRAETVGEPYSRGLQSPDLIRL